MARATYRIIPFVAVGANVARYFPDSTRYGVDLNVELPWGVLRGEYIGQHFDRGGAGDHGWYVIIAAPVTPWLQLVAKYERFKRGAPGAVPLKAWTVAANVRPWGKATRFTLEYVAHVAGDPASTHGLGLAQVQVLF